MDEEYGTIRLDCCREEEESLPWVSNDNSYHLSSLADLPICLVVWYVWVVGRPLATVKTADPSPEMIESVHKQYIDELQSIYTDYKDLYAQDVNKDLTIVQ